jgi:hypothetical protein
VAPLYFLKLEQLRGRGIGIGKYFVFTTGLKDGSILAISKNFSTVLYFVARSKFEKRR